MEDNQTFNTYDDLSYCAKVKYHHQLESSWSLIKSCVYTWSKDGGGCDQTARLVTTWSNEQIIGHIGFPIIWKRQNWTLWYPPQPCKIHHNHMFCTYHFHFSLFHRDNTYHDWLKARSSTLCSSLQSDILLRCLFEFHYRHLANIPQQPWINTYTYEMWDIWNDNSDSFLCDSCWWEIFESRCPRYCHWLCYIKSCYLPVDDLLHQPRDKDLRRCVLAR